MPGLLCGSPGPPSLFGSHHATGPNHWPLPGPVLGLQGQATLCSPSGSALLVHCQPIPQAHPSRVGPADESLPSHADGTRDSVGAGGPKTGTSPAQGNSDAPGRAGWAEPPCSGPAATGACNSEYGPLQWRLRSRFRLCTSLGQQWFTIRSPGPRNQTETKLGAIQVAPSSLQASPLAATIAPKPC